MKSTSISAPWRKALLTLHIATTVSVLGTDLVLLMLGIAGLSGSDPETVYHAAHLVGMWLTAPLAVLSLTTGLLLATLTGWGLLRYWWVAIKLAITATLTGLVLFVLLPALEAAADTATGPDPSSLTDSERLPLLIAPAVASALLALNVSLAVFKPGWRLRSGAARETAPVAAQTQAD